MAANSLKKIAKAAASFRNTRSVFADNPYSEYCEEKEWGETRSFTRFESSASLEKKSKKK